jgi:adenylylsulfate kinase
MSGGVTVWFTGLPCSGKTTIADELGERLRGEGYSVERLDGDIVRKSLTSDLGFSKEDRDENIKRVSFVAKLLTRNGVIVLATFVSPYRDRRQRSREEIGSFLEVYTRCPVKVCMERDVKGMYRKALAGEIKGFTGVDDPYEEPLAPDLILDTHLESVEESVDKVMCLLRERGFIQ